MKEKSNPFIIFIIIPLFVLVASCRGTNTTDTPEGHTTITPFAVTATVEPPKEESDLPGGEVGLLEGEIPTRTPVPTIAPGLLEGEVSRIISEMGVDEQNFLGLGIDDWIILGVSLLGVLAGSRL